MAIKLYVDDIRRAPEGWHLARTITEAIRILDTMEVEEVSLDHDIAIEISSNGIPVYKSSDETFEPVVRFINQSVPVQVNLKRVVIHTANPPAAMKMMEILKGGQKQGTTLPFDIVIKAASPAL